MDKKLMLYGEPDGKRDPVGRVLFVDPGLGGTGWAYWNVVCRSQKASRPESSGVLRKPERLRWLGACHALAAEFMGVLAGCFADCVVMEIPEFWTGSALGLASATHRNPGEPADLCKLLYLVGCLGQAAVQGTRHEPVLITPAEWKGQLDKAAIHRRIGEALPGFEAREHEADAIGMGLAAMGRL